MTCLRVKKYSWFWKQEWGKEGWSKGYSSGKNHNRLKENNKKRDAHTKNDTARFRLLIYRCINLQIDTVYHHFLHKLRKSKNDYIFHQDSVFSTSFSATRDRWKLHEHFQILKKIKNSLIKGYFVLPPPENQGANNFF